MRQIHAVCCKLPLEHDSEAGDLERGLSQKPATFAFILVCIEHFVLAMQKNYNYIVK